MRGIGWVIAAVDPMNRRLSNFWVSDHETGHAAGFIPIVVMDMWEHAYVLDFGAKAEGRAAYIETYFKNVDWSVIEDRLALADQGRVRPRDLQPNFV
jgi:superoxide dismutase, Fe-Mn family